MSSRGHEAAAAQLEEFIRERFRVPPDDHGFTRTVSLWDEGYIDSIGVAETIAFLEQHFLVTISNDVLFSSDFTNIDGIIRLVMQLKEKNQETPEKTMGSMDVPRVRKAGTAA